MANVEIELAPLTRTLLARQERAGGEWHKPRSEPHLAPAEEVEKPIRMGRVEDKMVPAPLNYGFRAATEMLHVSETNAVNTCWQSAAPPAPYEPGYIEEDVTACRAKARGLSLSL